MSKKFSEFTSVADPSGAAQIVGFTGGVNTRQRADALPISTDTQAALDTKASASGLSAHIADTANPHATTKTQVGLGNVPNVDATNMANAASGLLAVARGGTGTATPGLVSGTNISITGAWPNQTINSSGGGGGAAWGGITGTLSDQTDLQDALDLLAPLDSPVITGAPELDMDEDGLSISADGFQLGSIDPLGWLLRRPLIENPRVIGNADSPIIAIEDLLINGTRTDAEPLVLPAIGSASNGQHLSIAHTGAGTQPIDANAAGEIYDGAAGAVDSISLVVGETVVFRAIGTKWRVFDRYLSSQVQPAQMPALTGPVSTSAGAVATTMYWDRQIACSDLTTAITSGTSKAYFRVPRGVTLTAVRASVLTAPTGANLVIDINENGSTILSTKLSIDAGEKTSVTAATPPVISDANLADDAEITIDFDQVGSTIAGAGVIVTLIGTITG